MEYVLAALGSCQVITCQFWAVTLGIPGWSISAFARHLSVDRKTVRAYLSGQREPGRRQRTRPTLIEPFLDYCRVVRRSWSPTAWCPVGECAEVLEQFAALVDVVDDDSKRVLAPLLA